MRRTVIVLIFLCASFSQAREIPITIIATTDLHGHILPTADYEGHTNLGGIARCATMIKQIRAHSQNCLLVDAGDTLQGEPVSYLSEGQVMVKVLNRLHYDAWVWGNHEFDWGLGKLAVCTGQAEVPILNANLQLVGEPDEDTFKILKRVKPFRIVEVGGVKVGIIGLNSPGVPSWSRPRLLGGLGVADSIEMLKSVLPEVKRAGAEVLVLVCHQGYREGGDDHANQIHAIARSFPELDVIIGGHTHRNFPEAKFGNIVYCQADYFGIHLGQVDLVFDTAAHRVTRCESQTLLMDGRLAPDPEVVALCATEIERAKQELGTVIGEATGQLDSGGGPKHETEFHDLLFESIAESLQNCGVKVDVIVHGLLEKQRILKKGPITIGDVWGIEPYENQLGTFRASKAQLLEILEENAAGYEKREFRGVWGVRWRFDPRASAGHRTVFLTHADGTAIGDEESFTVACNSFDLASGGLRFKKLRDIADLPGSQLVEYDFQIRQAVIDYIRAHKTIAPQIQNWWQTVGKTKSR